MRKRTSYDWTSSVLNLMCGIRDAKDKKAESTEKNRATISATKAEDIVKQMTLGKANVDKLEAIEDNNKIVEAVGNITKPRMAAILMVYKNIVRVQTPQDILRLDFVAALNASGLLKNGMVVGG